MTTGGASTVLARLVSQALKSLRFLVATALVVGFGLVQTGCGDDKSNDEQSASHSTAAKDDGANWMFVVQSGSGSLKSTGGDNYKLKLSDVSKLTTAFTDRPRRDSTVDATAGFFKSWQKLGFESDPPNAALSTTTASGHPGESMDLELSEPNYDASNRTVTFAARRLPQLPSEYASHERESAKYFPKNFKPATLFIDSPRLHSYYYADIYYSNLTLEKFRTAAGTELKQGSWNSEPQDIDSTINGYAAAQSWCCVAAVTGTIVWKSDSGKKITLTFNNPPIIDATWKCTAEGNVVCDATELGNSQTLTVSLKFRTKQ